jgi:D-alanyl-D-alanine carboxypeptidase
VEDLVNLTTRRGFLLSLSGLLVGCRAAASTSTPLEVSRWAEVERLGARFVTARRMPGVSLAISHEGIPVFTGAWGYADLERCEQATTGTRFRIASVTKTFIGVLFLRLARSGILSLDDPASRWLPEFPRSGDFTIRMLLNHTAGLGEYTRRPLDILARDAQREYSNEALLAYMAALEPLFVGEPGGQFSYSNTGYVLLGIVAERAARVPLPQLLEEQLFVPAGLEETAWDDDHDPPTARATGYGFHRGSWVRAPFASSSYVGASGAIRSTARDVCAWYDALLRGTLLCAEELHEMLTPATLTDGRPVLTRRGSGYGLGIWSGRTEWGRVVWHTGSTAGFAADARHYADHRLSIVMIGNADARRVGSEPRRIREAVLRTMAVGQGM